MTTAFHQPILAIRQATLFAIAVLGSHSVAHGQSRPWLNDRPCSTALPASAFRLDTLHPSPPPRPGWPAASCATLHLGGTVCASDSENSRTIRVAGLRPGPIEISGYVYAPFDSVQVIEADLGADNTQEIIVAAVHAVGTGPGIEYWTVYTLVPGLTEWSRDTVEVQDYAFPGSWVATPGERRCNLLRTEWVWGWEPGRQGGLYLQATWLAYDDGRFVPRIDRPVLRRRLLDYFERLRGQRVTPDAPLGWFRSPLALPFVPTRHP